VVGKKDKNFNSIAEKFESLNLTIHENAAG